MPDSEGVQVPGSSDLGIAAQVKAMAQQAANLALQSQNSRLNQVEVLLQDMNIKLAAISAASPEKSKTMEVPAPLKWGAAIVSAVITLGVSALFFWLISTVNDMQQTLVRIDERQKAQTENRDERFTDHDRRISRLERALAEGGKQ